VRPAGPAVEQGRVPVGPLPRGGVVGELLAGAQPVAVGVDPFAQPGPGAQQRLVADPGGVVVEGEQPGLGEPVDRLLRGGRVGQAVYECGQVDRPGGVGGGLAHPHQPGQHAPHGFLSGRVQRGVGLLGSAVVAIARAIPPAAR